MKNYFKMIGYIELMLWLVVIVSYSIYMGSVFSDSNAISQMVLILTLILIIIVGPSLGFLFISHSNLKNDNLNLHLEIEDLKKNHSKDKDDLIRKYAAMQWDVEELKKHDKKEN